MTDLGRKRLRWNLALSLGATVAILVLLVHSFGNAAELGAAVHRARLSWVGVSFLAASACVALTTLRWQLVVRSTGHRLGFGRALHIVLATWPLAVVTPSRANDLLRPIAARDVLPLAIGTGGVLAEKAIDLLVLLAFAGLGAALAALWPWAAIIGGLLAVELAVLALVVTKRAWIETLPILRRRRDKVEELFRSLSALARSPARLSSVAAASFAIRVLTVAVTYALLVSVGAKVGFGDAIALWPAAMLVGLAPVTLGGMGTRDAAFLALLAARGAHVDASSVLAATIGYSLVATWSFAIIGLPFMVREAHALRTG